MTALSEVDRTSSETLGGDDSVQIPDLAYLRVERIHQLWRPVT